MLCSSLDAGSNPAASTKLMKKVLVLALLIIILSSICSFSLKKYVNEYDWKYSLDIQKNKLTLSTNGDTFTFLINESIYYKGINIYHLDEAVTIENNDILISDNFLKQWVTGAKGIYNFDHVSKRNNCTFSIYSHLGISINKLGENYYEVSSKAKADLGKSYFNKPYPGIDYIKIKGQNLLIKFKYITVLKYNIDAKKCVFTYKYEKSAIEKKSIAGNYSSGNKTLNKKIIKIIIDPGHGGKDPGAIGITGIKEKNVVLAIGKKLASTLQKEGYTVIMTRNKDFFVPLRGRSKIANKRNGSIFISIHANFSYNPKSRGFEIYYLSKSASDDEARHVAAYENNVIQLENKSTGGLLNDIIWSMISNEFENESILLAGLITKHLKTIGPPHGRPIKHARFYVLYGATMPAILIETGFLTNRKEEKNLNTASYQKKLVSKIAKAIDIYIEKNYRKFIQ
ncbi:N-acetylmuramoyl-L-alanine amidase [bacterium]|nr:N-acetylmuramoyl-L-alanine amidase [bacterium]